MVWIEYKTDDDKRYNIVNCRYIGVGLHVYLNTWLLGTQINFDDCDRSIELWFGPIMIEIEVTDTGGQS